MNLTEKVIWAELKFRILEAAMLLNDGSDNKEVIERLMEAVDILDNTQP